MSVALIAVNSVLRKHVGGAAIPEGMRLYQALAKTGRVVLLADDADPETLDWLELNGCVQHDFVDTDTLSTHVDRANGLRRLGYDIDLVIEPNPDAALSLIKAGFNTLLFTHAQYTQPAWRPDTDPGVRPWDDITRQVADQARMKAADARLRRDDD